MNFYFYKDDQVKVDQNFTLTEKENSIGVLLHSDEIIVENEKIAIKDFLNSYSPVGFGDYNENYPFTMGGHSFFKNTKVDSIVSKRLLEKGYTYSEGEILVSKFTAPSNDDAMGYLDLDQDKIIGLSSAFQEEGFSLITDKNQLKFLVESNTAIGVFDGSQFAEFRSRDGIENKIDIDPSNSKTIIAGKTLNIDDIPSNVVVIEGFENHFGTRDGAKEIIEDHSFDNFVESFEADANGFPKITDFKTGFKSYDGLSSPQRVTTSDSLVFESGKGYDFLKAELQKIESAAFSWKPFHVSNSWSSILLDGATPLFPSGDQKAYSGFCKGDRTYIYEDNSLSIGENAISSKNSAVLSFGDIIQREEHFEENLIDPRTKSVTDHKVAEGFVFEFEFNDDFKKIADDCSLFSESYGENNFIAGEQNKLFGNNNSASGLGNRGEGNNIFIGGTKNFSSYDESMAFGAENDIESNPQDFPLAGQFKASLTGGLSNLVVGRSMTFGSSNSIVDERTSSDSKYFDLHFNRDEIYGSVLFLHDGSISGNSSSNFIISCSDVTSVDSRFSAMISCKNVDFSGDFNVFLNSDNLEVDSDRVISITKTGASDKKKSILVGVDSKPFSNKQKFTSGGMLNEIGDCGVFEAELTATRDSFSISDSDFVEMKLDTCGDAPVDFIIPNLSMVSFDVDFFITSTNNSFFHDASGSPVLYRYGTRSYLYRDFKQDAVINHARYGYEINIVGDKKMVKDEGVFYSPCNLLDSADMGSEDNGNMATIDLSYSRAEKHYKYLNSFEQGVFEPRLTFNNATGKLKFEIEVLNKTPLGLSNEQGKDVWKFCAIIKGNILTAEHPSENPSGIFCTDVNFQPSDSSSGGSNSSSSGSGSTSGSGSESGSSSGSGSGSSCCNPECVFIDTQDLISLDDVSLTMTRQPDCTYLSDDTTIVLKWAEVGEPYPNDPSTLSLGEWWIIRNGLLLDYMISGSECLPAGFYDGQINIDPQYTSPFYVYECCPVDITCLNVFLPNSFTGDGDKNITMIGSVANRDMTGSYTHTVDGTINVFLEWSDTFGWGLNDSGYVFAGSPAAILDRCNPTGNYEQGIVVAQCNSSSSSSSSEALTCDPDTTCYRVTVTEGGNVETFQVLGSLNDGTPQFEGFDQFESAVALHWNGTNWTLGSISYDMTGSADRCDPLGSYVEGANSAVVEECCAEEITTVIVYYDRYEILDGYVSVATLTGSTITGVFSGTFDGGRIMALTWNSVDLGWDLVVDGGSPIRVDSADRCDPSAPAAGGEDASVFLLCDPDVTSYVIDNTAQFGGNVTVNGSLNTPSATAGTNGDIVYFDGVYSPSVPLELTYNPIDGWAIVDYGVPHYQDFPADRCDPVGTYENGRSVSVAP